MKWEECQHIERIGNTAVFVKKGCKEALRLRGKLVSTKSRCEQCMNVGGAAVRKRGRPVKCNKDHLEEYVRAGMENKEIAEKMGIGVSTVASWVKKYNLTGIRKRGGAVVKKGE